MLSTRLQAAVPARARTRVPSTSVSEHARAQHAEPGTQLARKGTLGSVLGAVSTQILSMQPEAHVFGTCVL
eukprot:14784848-Alexandrium_andersonii.AAC.1